MAYMAVGSPYISLLTICGRCASVCACGGAAAVQVVWWCLWACNSLVYTLGMLAIQYQGLATCLELIQACCKALTYLAIMIMHKHECMIMIAKLSPRRRPERPSRLDGSRPWVPGPASMQAAWPFCPPFNRKRAPLAAQSFFSKLVFEKKKSVTPLCAGPAASQAKASRP